MAFSPCLHIFWSRGRAILPSAACQKRSTGSSCAVCHGAGAAGFLPAAAALADEVAPLLLGSATEAPAAAELGPASALGARGV